MSPIYHQGMLAFRGFLPMLGIICVNMILLGAFQVMLCSGRDDDEHHGMEKIAKGVLGSIAIAGAFAVATISLANT